MRDIGRLQAAYPDLRNITFLKSGRVQLEVVLSSECGVNIPITLSMEFPGEYPDREPMVYDAENLFEHIPNRHFYPNGKMCLWLPEDSAWNPDDADTIITLFDHVVTYLDRQRIYDVIGKWPGGERAHGQVGYLEYLKEIAERESKIAKDIPNRALPITGKFGRNTLCPCGSGRKYKYCHGAK
jgi:hypothetical protein